MGAAAPSHPRLVRNMSLPALHGGHGPAGHAPGGRGFARVSSFSRMANPALLHQQPASARAAAAAAAANVNSGGAADFALVPQLHPALGSPDSDDGWPPPSVGDDSSSIRPSSQPAPDTGYHSPAPASAVAAPSAAASDGNPAGRGHQHVRFLQHHHAARQLGDEMPVASTPAESIDEGNDAGSIVSDPCSDASALLSQQIHGHHHHMDQRRQEQEQLNTSSLPTLPERLAGGLPGLPAVPKRVWAALLVRSLSATSIPSPPLAPDERANFLFVAALSYMCGAPALAYASTALRDAPTRLPLFAATGLLATPLLSRAFRSLLPTVAIFACAALAFIVSAASHSSPAVLVWTSIVPLAAFSTLPTRGVVAASAAAAAAVFVADHQQNGAIGSLASPENAPSPAVIIAVWVMFLGLVGVVQTHIHAVVVREDNGHFLYGTGYNRMRGRKAFSDADEEDEIVMHAEDASAYGDDAKEQNCMGEEEIEEEGEHEDQEDRYCDEDADVNEDEEYVGVDDEEDEDDDVEIEDDVENERQSDGFRAGLRQRRNSWR
jgi:hypothetical protein